METKNSICYKLTGIEKPSTNNEQPMNSEYPTIDESNKLYERASKIMFPVTQTMAKGPSQYVNGVAPKYIKNAKDATLENINPNKKEKEINISILKENDNQIKVIIKDNGIGILEENRDKIFSFGFTTE
jgi:nitrogen fixation/metabolism regulation signal transduction histidine kinase